MPPEAIFDHLENRGHDPTGDSPHLMSVYSQKSPQWWGLTNTHTHTHTHAFNGPFSGTTRVSRYQKSKTSLDFTEVRDSEWQWNPLGHMQVCTSLQTDNHASTRPLSFLQARYPSCRPTNSVTALKAQSADSALMLIVCLPVVSVSLSVHMASSCQLVALGYCSLF